MYVLGSSMDSIDKPHTDQKRIKVATRHPKSTQMGDTGAFLEIEAGGAQGRDVTTSLLPELRNDSLRPQGHTVTVTQRLLRPQARLQKVRVAQVVPEVTRASLYYWL